MNNLTAPLLEATCQSCKYHNEWRMFIDPFSCVAQKTPVNSEPKVQCPICGSTDVKTE